MTLSYLFLKQMKPLYTTLRQGILLLVLTCSMGVTAQTSKAVQSNNQPVTLPSTNKGDTITDRVSTGKIYDVVDENPHFPGGNGAMLDWLSKNIHYTSGCASIKGRVVVTFYVEPDGSLSDIELVQKVDSELDKEVLRVVKAMPKWIPASQNNKPIRTKYTLPIGFRCE